MSWLLRMSTSIQLALFLHAAAYSEMSASESETGTAASFAKCLQKFSKHEFLYNFTCKNTVDLTFEKIDPSQPGVFLLGSATIVRCCRHDPWSECWKQSTECDLCKMCFTPHSFVSCIIKLAHLRECTGKNVATVPMSRSLFANRPVPWMDEGATRTRCSSPSN